MEKEEPGVTGSVVSNPSPPLQDVEKKGDGYVLKSDPSVRVSARAHKMSKSRGNVVNPDDVVFQFGADSLRLYEMFMGPLRDTKVGISVDLRLSYFCIRLSSSILSLLIRCGAPEVWRVCTDSLQDPSVCLNPG